MRETKLQMHRGDAASFNVAALQDDGITPLDITAATLWFTAKHRRTDLDASAVIQKTSAAGTVVIVNGPLGLARVDLAVADTSTFVVPTTLYWDLQAKVGGKDRTLAKGRLRVELDVTRAT